MQTPEFKGTHLFDRLCWAKENLEGVQSDYRVVYEDSVDECAKILVPDPNWMACALQGGILPPVWVYHELAKDEAQPDFKKHTRGYLLHNTEPVPAMTEEEAIEYLILKDCPESVWKTYNEGNRLKMVICKKEQLPQTREWRNAWKISDDLSLTDLAAQEKLMVNTYIVDKDGNQADASTVTVPANRDFRGAWVLNGAVISEDIESAREIFKDKVREARKPLLETKDVELMKALETGADTTAIAAAKNALRDAPAAAAIANATTITELKAAWDTSVLGASPY